MKKLYKTVLICTIAWLTTNVQAQNKLVYIYKSDSTEASAYKKFLTGYGFETHLLEIQEIANFNFRDKNLIIAGSNSSDTWQNWGTANDVAIIKQSKKPILALCYGGGGLTYKLNSWVHGGNTAGNGFGSTLKVIFPDDNLYKFPLNVSLTVDSIFAPFTGNSMCSNYLYTGDNYTSQVKLYDRSNVNLYKNYTGLASDSSKYYYLGYYAAAPETGFSEAGKNFFVNLIYKAGNFNFTVTNLLSTEIKNSTDLVYPNPTKGILNINSAQQINSVEIYNAMGILVAKLNNPTNQMDVSNLNAGTYTLKIQSDSKVQYSKIIIE